MPLIILGVVILLIALLAPIIWEVLVWVFSNLITTAVVLIALGVVFVVAKTMIKFIFFETDENTGNYIEDEFGCRVRKDLRGVLEGLFVTLIVLGFVVYGIQAWLAK